MAHINAKPAPAKPLRPYAEPLPGVDAKDLAGKLIVIEGPDAVGRSTQVAQLRQWLEQQGHAVLDTGMARSALAGKGIAQAKDGNTLGPVTMTLYYVTDFADRLENEIIPALRAGFIVLTDRYIFSIMARAIARGEDPGGSNAFAVSDWFRTLFSTCARASRISYRAL